ncbi:MAG: sigma-54 dependent transcriptional regulator [Acidobacteriota bacterium]
MLVEDDPDVAFATERRLRGLGHEVKRAASGAEANALLRRMMSEGGADAALLDLGLPDADGLRVLEQLLALAPSCPVAVLTARDEAQSAVRALRLGAVDYLVKPAPGDLLRHALERIGRAASRAESLRSVDRRTTDRPDFLGEASAFRRFLDQLRAAARSPRTPVLLRGESGTGKEKAAARLHAWSQRSRAPFITANAASMPASLLEAELFGHEAGAFTGAKGARRGLFEMASGGVLFLDEIGELQPEVQPKLLRVLEGHPFRRIGGEREMRCDVRLVTATHRDLEKEVAEGRFREDLYHRIRVLEIELPPLRERISDLEPLCDHFLNAMAQEMGLERPRLAERSLELLRAYAWPGNVRELKNTLERALVLGDGASLEPRHLPSYLLRRETPPFSGEARPPLGGRAEKAKRRGEPREESGGAAPLLTLDEAMRRHVEAVLDRCEGNLTHAAAKLGITRGTLRRRLRGWEHAPNPE